ncbi:MAG: hypothetical protein V1690_02030 [Candidatus Moraniibacteriota bacterium]
MSKRDITPYIPSNDEKKEGLELHVYEEVVVFVECYKRLKNGIKEKNNLRITHESFLLHARNLYEFLSGDLTEKDDILAVHFIKETIPISGFPKTEINKQLSHITYSRRNPTDLLEDSSKGIDEVYNKIKLGINIFRAKIGKSSYKDLPTL